jgi:5-guanidino-2-oxopentanoate decarboxylase
MNQTLSAGEALVELLADYGVELVFGIPGTHSIELYRGLSSSSIRHISPRHEQGGGFMADGYARVSGKPGVCFVITGPGVTNISTPVGEAYMDFVPLLVISPVNDPDPDKINRGRLHEITCQTDVTIPLTAMSITVTDIAQIPESIAQAFDIFNSEAPRPVHISIPLSIIPQRVTGKWKVTSTARPKFATDAQINAALQLIEKSKNIVIVAGGGTTTGSEYICKLAERLCCPVLTTVAGRGVIPANHPLCVGAQLRARYVQQILEQADLAIFLGTELSQTDHWNDSLRLPPSQVWVNLNRDCLDRGQSALAIEGECIHFVKRLLKMTNEPGRVKIDAAYEFCSTARSLLDNELTAKERVHWSVLTTIIAHIPVQATIVSDMTQIAYTAVGYLPMSRPNQWLHPTGYGTLGYALPAAIGAVLADDSRPALVLVGDGGIQYTMQEMTLASELSLNIVVLLWNNDALLQIYDDMTNAGISPIGVVQKNPDFVALALACGWKAWQVMDLSNLGTELGNAFDLPGPVLLKLDESDAG